MTPPTITPDRAPHSHRQLNAFMRHLADRNRSEATIDTYTTLLTWLDRTLPYGLAQTHADELRDAIWTPDRSARTIALYRTAAGSFFRWACNPADMWIDYDPTIHLPHPTITARKPRPVPDEVLADILGRAWDPYRLWLLLAAGQGLRCVEISRLDREDITQDATYILGKGGRERTVPTHPAVWEAVRSLPVGPVALGRDRRRATRRTVMASGNRHLRRLGHEGVTMHRLRHWYGTGVYRSSGHDLRVAQELLGHASPHTTQVYVATEDKAKRAAVQALALPV